MNIKSMTGYGKGIYEDADRKICVEIKAVNHRFFDINIKLPKSMNFGEDLVRKTIKEKISRGHLDVYINYEDFRKNKNSLQIDESLAGEYLRKAEILKELYGVNNNIGAYELLRFPDVVIESIDEDDEKVLEKALQFAVKNAVDTLEKMRSVEGVKMIEDVMQKLLQIEDLVNQVEKIAPTTVDNHRKKVFDRINEYLKEVPLDEVRLINEIALFSDKVAVDEEIARLRSHISHFKKITESETPGKRLDFIVQEMNRETNTIGSKCCEVEISSIVVELKSTIEKIREQIQNIE